jgi:lipopolysaccharide transport system ATP-binding protein
MWCNDMSNVISVENLGKKYQLSHQGKRESYLVLRDVISDACRSFAARALSPFLARNPAPNAASCEEFWALKDISFEVKQGSRIGIIGRNGAGKSTLLKILSRITEPTTGRVRIKGRVASLLEVGTGFHPELTGRENIFLNGAILGMGRAEIRGKFDEIVSFAEVEKFLDTPVKRYSSGMYVRLAFAVAAHLDPDILVVDEVLAVGDAQFQRKCLGKMEDVSKTGRTVLFVSHNIAMVKALCNQALLLEGGSVKTFGKAEETINQYLTSNISTRTACVELLSHARSAGNNRAIMRGWVETATGEFSQAVPTGTEIALAFQYALPAVVSELDFGFGIETLEGLRVFSVNNKTTESFFGDAPRAGIAKCRIPELQLLPGTYFLSFSIVDGKTGWVDYVERAMLLEVLENDVFGTGKMYEKTQGLIYTRSKIEIVGVDSYVGKP